MGGRHRRNRLNSGFRNEERQGSRRWHRQPEYMNLAIGNGVRLWERHTAETMLPSTGRLKRTERVEKSILNREIRFFVKSKMPMREERVEQQIQRTFGPFVALLCTLGYTAKRLATAFSTSQTPKIVGSCLKIGVGLW